MVRMTPLSRRLERNTCETCPDRCTLSLVEFVIEYLSIDESTIGSDGRSTSRDPSPEQTLPESIQAPTSADGGTRRLSLHLTSPSGNGGGWTPECSSTTALHNILRDVSTNTTLNTSHSSPSSRLSHRTLTLSALTTRQWPLVNENEALLMRHFVTDLSQWVLLPLSREFAEPVRLTFDAVRLLRPAKHFRQRSRTMCCGITSASVCDSCSFSSTPKRYTGP